MTIEERASAAGLTLHHTELHAFGACTKYFAAADGMLHVGCWDAHENFYWHPPLKEAR